MTLSIWSPSPKKNRSEIKVGYARISSIWGPETGLETQNKILKKNGCEKIFSEALVELEDLKETNQESVWTLLGKEIIFVSLVLMQRDKSIGIFLFKSYAVT
tara:strand:- start:404 stop:709 length:306 start_codon:yes stop_codon:yes gene_type:complete